MPGPEAVEIARLWRQKQLEYAFRLTAMGAYNDLERFPDVEPGLSRLKRAGHQMIVLSNGNPAMLEPLMDAAGLRPFFDGYVSVD